MLGFDLASSARKIACNVSASPNQIEKINVKVKGKDGDGDTATISLLLTVKDGKWALLPE
mgnify:CR=1 FL=1